MSISYPLTGLIEGLSLRDGYLKPVWRQEGSVTGNGVSVIKDMGPMLWRGTWQTAVMLRDDAMDLETDLLSLQGGVHLFEGYDPRRPVPRVDTGEDLSAVTVAAVRADRLALRLAGLPAGFTLSKSDYVSIEAAGNLHLLKCALGSVADGAGETGWLEVRPFVRSAIVPGMTAMLRQPCARFQLEKDSVERQPDGNLDRISFSALQVIT